MPRRSGRAGLCAGRDGSRGVDGIVVALACNRVVGSAAHWVIPAARLGESSIVNRTTRAFATPLRHGDQSRLGAAALHEGRSGGRGSLLRLVVVREGCNRQLMVVFAMSCSHLLLQVAPSRGIERSHQFVLRRAGRRAWLLHGRGRRRWSRLALLRLPAASRRRRNGGLKERWNRWG